MIQIDPAILDTEADIGTLLNAVGNAARKALRITTAEIETLLAEAAIQLAHKLGIQHQAAPRAVPGQAP